MTYDEIMPGSTIHAKSKLKKATETKSNKIDFDTFSQVDIIRCVFAIHGIADKYEVSPMRGPNFKLWFTGSG